MRRFKGPQSRYIPTDSKELRGEHGVVYEYEAAGVLYAVAYRGNAGKPDWHYRFRTAEKRRAQIASWFESLNQHAAYKAKRAEERRAERAKEKQSLAGAEALGDYSLTGTAEAIRQTLQSAFPCTKFSVRSKSYSGGCSINVAWTDGPNSKQVERITDAFQGADFDGMQDLKTYRDATEWHGRRVRFHVDYVFGNRSYSDAVLSAVADVVSYQAGCACPAVEDGSLKGADVRLPFQWHDFWTNDEKTIRSVDEVQLSHDSGGNGEWSHTLIYRICSALSLEDPQPVEVPHVVTVDYIDQTVRSLIGN